jgi:hypothetical protein
MEDPLAIMMEFGVIFADFLHLAFDIISSRRHDFVMFGL